MGTITKEMEKHKTYICHGWPKNHHGWPKNHHGQAIIEPFHCTLAQCLFGHQDAVEMLLVEGQQSITWVKRLPRVVATLNNKTTHLTGKKPAEVLKEKAVAAMPGTPYSRHVRKNETILPSEANARYFYQPG